MLFHLFQSAISFAQEAVTVAAPPPAPMPVSPLAAVNWAVVFAVLWGLAETLALIPSIKSNSLFTLVYNTLKAIHDKIQK